MILWYRNDFSYSEIADTCHSLHDNECITSNNEHKRTSPLGYIIQQKYGNLVLASHYLADLAHDNHVKASQNTHLQTGAKSHRSTYPEALNPNPCINLASSACLSNASLTTLA